MKRFYLIAVAMFCVASAFAQEDAVKRDVGMASAAVGKAIAANDFAALEKLWSPRMVVNSPGNSVLTRDQVFAAMKRGQLTYEDTKITLEHFDVFGDIAVQMGQESYKPTFGPENGKLLYRRFTNIWQKTADGWLQIARQATIFDPSVKHY